LLAGWLVVGCFSAGELFADTPIAKVIRWDNNVEDGTAYALAPTRGETMILQPRFLQYGVPMDLTHAYTVYMIYKAVGDTNTYSVSGTILNATNGQAQIEWSSSNELAATTYAYDVLVSDSTRTVVGARGAIKFRDGVATGATLQDLQPINILDFDQVLLLNVGNAPFLSSYEINDIREYLTAIQTGIGDIDARDVTIRGTLNYTNWPAYLARTNQIPMQSAVAAGANITVAISTNAGRIVYTVTSTASGSGGGGIGSYTNTMINGVTHSNSVSIADGSNITWAQGTDGVWRASSSIPASWASTGTLYWVVNGQTIGRVDSNGITMLHGSLTLQEEDLLCNVRLYDGSRVSPSITFQGHPGTWGLYAKGYNGSYSAAWSQGNTEIGIMSGLGINLMTTNAAFTGRHVGDLSGCTNYPEPIATNWLASRQLPSLTITNSGALTVKDAGGSTTFVVDGSTGATTVRGQDTDSRYILANTNWPTFILTNLFATKTNVLWYYRGIVTNRVQL
jgi:hypothetical protein